jgi:5-methylcytosine-specific restriction enzyme subunit McrC
MIAKAMMSPIPRPDATPALVVELVEWDQVGPAQDPRLHGTSLADDLAAQRLAEALRGRLDIREGYQGLEITTTSFVGRVDVGPVRISIRPKLPAMPLARLLRYAYGLRDVTTLEETRTPTTRHGLHDLLIAMLAAEVEELLHRALARRYVSLSERLESPRGRILVDQLVSEGGVREARLPCQHFERHINWQLNQVLRAGLDVAARMSEDRDLQRCVHRLAERFGEVERKAKLDVGEIDRAEHDLTRLTAANAPALTIIRLLHDMLGVEFEPLGDSSRMPGFLFDMNVFFQRLLSRFLHDNLTSARIEDERAIRNVFAYALDANPRRRRAPTPRPDYALFRGNALCSFLDAKYRDIWERSLPAEWLYQLSIYALASPSQVSVLLYASMGTEPCDERVEVRQPVLWSSKGTASVILRPVSLPHLAELLDRDRGGRLSIERQRWAERLVVLQSGIARAATTMHDPGRHSKFN